jgi:hypothetical protein
VDKWGLKLKSTTLVLKVSKTCHLETIPTLLSCPFWVRINITSMLGEATADEKTTTGR